MPALVALGLALGVTVSAGVCTTYLIVAVASGWP